MRVSSLTLSTAALAGIRNEQTAIARLTQQIATNERVLTPKDDPVRAPRILELADRIALREQYLANQDRARSALTYQATVMQGMRKVLEHARGILTGATPTHDPVLREQFARQIGNDYLQLKDLANTRDPAGNYLFAGFKTNTLPYAHTQMAPDDDANPATPATSGAASYAGDGGVREVQIDFNRRVQVSDDLAPVFDPGGPNDLLRALDQAAIELRQNPGTGLLEQADIDNAIQVIDRSLQRLGEIERRVAAAQQEIGDVQSVTRALLNEEKNALGKLTELDQAAAIVELQRRQVTLEAAQRAYARTSGLSLFNYL